jgi:hypothetical protein
MNVAGHGEFSEECVWTVSIPVGPGRVLGEPIDFLVNVRVTSADGIPVDNADAMSNEFNGAPSVKEKLSGPENVRATFQWI